MSHNWGVMGEAKEMQVEEGKIKKKWFYVGIVFNIGKGACFKCLKLNILNMRTCYYILPVKKL